MSRDFHGLKVLATVGSVTVLLPAFAVAASGATDPSQCQVVQPYLPGGPVGLPPVSSDDTAGVGDVLKGADAAYVASLGATWGVAAQWFVWYRDGEVVSKEMYDATLGVSRRGTTYQVTSDDIGHTLTYVVGIKWGSGCNVVHAPAAAPPVAVKSESKVHVVVRGGATTAPRLRIHVAQQRVQPKGLVTVAWQGASRGSVVVPLGMGDRGRATVKLAGLRSGKYRVKTTFTDTSGNAFDGASRRRTVRVR